MFFQPLPCIELEDTAQRLDTDVIEAVAWQAKQLCAKLELMWERALIPEARFAGRRGSIVLRHWVPGHPEESDRVSQSELAVRGLLRLLLLIKKCLNDAAISIPLRLWVPVERRVLVVKMTKCTRFAIVAANGCPKEHAWLALARPKPLRQSRVLGYRILQILVLDHRSV